MKFHLKPLLPLFLTNAEEVDTANRIVRQSIFCWLRERMDGAEKLVELVDILPHIGRAVTKIPTRPTVYSEPTNVGPPSAHKSVKHPQHLFS